METALRLAAMVLHEGSYIYVFTQIQKLRSKSLVSSDVQIIIILTQQH